MGLFDIFKSSDSEKSESVREVRIEGRQGDVHEHNDGTSGRDTYAVKVSYVDGVNVHEKDADFSHISNGSSTPDHVK